MRIGSHSGEKGRREETSLRRSQCISQGTGETGKKRQEGQKIGGYGNRFREWGKLSKPDLTGVEHTSDVVQAHTFRGFRNKFIKELAQIRLTPEWDEGGGV